MEGCVQFFRFGPDNSRACGGWSHSTLTVSGYIQIMTIHSTALSKDRWVSQRGITNFEMLLVFLIVLFGVGTLVPTYLASNRVAAEREIGIRLAVIQEAKRDVMKEMNLILPRESRLRITDPVNPDHLDKIAKLTLESPWRFHPEEPDPLGGTISVGETFLEPPSSSLGIPIADLSEITHSEESSGGEE